MNNNNTTTFDGKKVASMLNVFEGCSSAGNFLSDSDLIELSAALGQIAIFLRRTDNRMIASHLVQTQSAVDRMIEARKEK